MPPQGAWASEVGASSPYGFDSLPAVEHKVFWGAPEALRERLGSDFLGPETCVRALLASMSFVGRFLAPQMSHVGCKSGVFCQFILVSWGLFGALLFGRFSLRLSSGIWSLRALRDKRRIGLSTC